MNDNYLNRGMDNLKKLIHEMGFGEIEAELLNYSRPSIRVETTVIENEDELAIGQSKIGGRPDLPKDMDWVTVKTHHGRGSLQFLAQIDLTEVKLHDAENLLPDTGILYFFGDPWQASDYKERGQVIYFDGDKSLLERKPFPDDLSIERDSYEVYAPCSVIFVPEVNLHDEVIDSAESYPAEKTWEDLSDLVETTSYTLGRIFPHAVNRLLGFNHDVPSDMQLQCQLVEDTGSPYDASVDQWEAAEKKKMDWQLLFQIDSDDKANMSWSDAGTICFYIKKQDLVNKNFDNVCLAFFTS